MFWLVLIFCASFIVLLIGGCSLNDILLAIGTVGALVTVAIIVAYLSYYVFEVKKVQPSEVEYSVEELLGDEGKCSCCQ